MKNTLTASFLAWRRAKRRASFGAVALLSPLAAAPDSGASDLARRIVAEHSTDDGTGASESPLASGEDVAPAGFAAGSYLLTPAERAALMAARPGSRSLIFKAIPRADEPESEPLPADYAPAPLPDLAPVFDRSLFSTAELEEIDSEAAAEIAALEGIAQRDAAAVGFRSDYDVPPPVDYAPAVPALARAASVAAIAVPVSEFEALRLAILAAAR